MSKIYITTDDTGKVQLIHNMPFDAQYGFHQTEQELLKTGYLVDFVPDYTEQLSIGKSAVLYYNGTEFYWEIQDRPLTEDEKLSQLLLKQDELEINTDFRLIMLEKKI